MGEVYRADDLLLGQPVALKFLPPAATANVSTLNRFRNEVRVARQVSHPSVCRVYDIGEAEGLTYLSMEFVDGEDLASLLRRIGKLPEQKALEIARQLCAGVAAAHDKNVIHRDLKPANIMLDGKGQVRITDFGIAGVSEQIRDARSGTPAYMSPEQLAGKEVTTRSDIYALGIVLCELLTGKRPPLEVNDTDIDPAVERVIRKCLEPDPQMRPGSILSVAAALPGLDPLAAALARGDTPEPEVVANAGPIEGLHPWVAVTFLMAVIVGLGLLCVLRQKHDLINQIPMENSPEVLAAKAREIAKSLGYTERPVDTIYSWKYDQDYVRFAREQKKPSAELSAPYPPAVYFWYRQSPQYPITADPDTNTLQREALGPGMQAVQLDSEGRLLEFEARPTTESYIHNLSATTAVVQCWLAFVVVLATVNDVPRRSWLFAFNESDIDRSSTPVVGGRGFYPVNDVDCNAQLWSAFTAHNRSPGDHADGGSGYADPVRRAGGGCCTIRGLCDRDFSTNHKLVGLVRPGRPARNRHIGCTGTVRVRDYSFWAAAVVSERGRILKLPKRWPKSLTR
jgi:serine/threonine-protein kinase